MNKIKEWFQRYLKKNSRWKIAGDIVFYVFIILMIIPYTRKPVSATLIRLTMRTPVVKEAENLTKLSKESGEWRFQDLGGDSFSLKEFEGELILLNFWATWCPPCRAEMPSLQRLYDSYGDKISMILMSSEKKEVIEEYLKEGGFTFPVYIQRSALPADFKVSSIPATYLIGTDGTILYQKKGAANWNSDKFRTRIDEILRGNN